MPGEFEFIEWLTRRQKPSSLVNVPGGDDLAVLKWPAADLLLAGVDQVLDGVHFDCAIHSPRQIGAKVMNRNLSDCAAMACLPAAALVCAALPVGAGIEYAKELYLGMEAAAERFDCAVVGGDTATWPGKLALSVTILGRSAGVEPVTRAGAKPGDGIYVSGPLGGSILGRHLSFVPRIELARGLAERREVSSMIDISDGLSRDLGHVCGASGVGAMVEASRIPIHDDAILLSRRDHVEPLKHALHDGEDYELLYTCRGAASAGILVGRIVEGPGVFLEKGPGMIEPLDAQGWEHKM